MDTTAVSTVVEKSVFFKTTSPEEEQDFSPILRLVSEKFTEFLSLSDLYNLFTAISGDMSILQYKYAKMSTEEKMLLDKRYLALVLGKREFNKFKSDFRKNTELITQLKLYTENPELFKPIVNLKALNAFTDKLPVQDRLSLIMKNYEKSASIVKMGKLQKDLGREKDFDKVCAFIRIRDFVKGNYTEFKKSVLIEGEQSFAQYFSVTDQKIKELLCDLPFWDEIKVYRKYPHYYSFCNYKSLRTKINTVEISDMDILFLFSEIPEILDRIVDLNEVLEEAFSLIPPEKDTVEYWLEIIKYSYLKKSIEKYFFPLYKVPTRILVSDYFLLDKTWRKPRNSDIYKYIRNKL